MRNEIASYTDGVLLFLQSALYFSFREVQISQHDESLVFRCCLYAERTWRLSIWYHGGRTWVPHAILGKGGLYGTQCLQLLSYAGLVASRPLPLLNVFISKLVQRTRETATSTECAQEGKRGCLSPHTPLTFSGFAHILLKEIWNLLTEPQIGVLFISMILTYCKQWF